MWQMYHISVRRLPLQSDREELKFGRATHRAAGLFELQSDREELKLVRGSTPDLARCRFNRTGRN